MRARHRDSLDVVLFWALRGLAFGLVAVCTYCNAVMMSLRIGSAVQMLRVFLVGSCLFLLTSSSIPVGVVLNLRGFLQFGYLGSILAYTLVEETYWGPTIAWLLAVPVPEAVRSPFRKAWLLTAVTTVLYQGFWAISFLFHEVDNAWLKLAIAVFTPWLLGSICFHLYFEYAERVLGLKTNATCATLLLVVPTSWFSTMQAMLQLGAFEFAPAVGLELIALVLEVRTKLSLMQGVLPLQIPLQLLRSCTSWCRELIARKEVLVVPSEVQTSPSKLEMDELQKALQRREFLVGVVCAMNLSELVVHMLVACMYIMIKMNPGEEGAPPIPWTRTLALSGLKVGAELLTDVVITSLSVDSESGSEMDQGSNYTVGSRFQELGWGSKLCICAISVFMFFDIASASLTFLCPSQSPEGVSLSPCPAGVFL